MVRAAPATRSPGLEPLDAHTHIGSNDPDGYSVHPRAARRLARADRRARLRLPDARAGRLSGRQRHGDRRGGGHRTAACSRSAGSTRTATRSPRPSARSTAARAASSCTRAPSTSRSTTRSSQPCSRSPTSGGCRCSSMPAAASPRSAATPSRSPAAHPGMRLILAHAGISDLAWIWREAPDHPNLFFDTSWWSPADLQALFALVPPGQILMASDAPYGSPTWASVMTTRNALQVGPRSPSRLAASLGGQALRIVNGEEPLDLGPPPGDDAALARSAARPRLLLPPERDRPGVQRRRAGGDARARAARLRCRRRRARRPPVCRWVLELLDARARATHRRATAGPRGSPPDSTSSSPRSASYERPTCPCQSFAASPPGSAHRKGHPEPRAGPVGTAQGDGWLLSSMRPRAAPRARAAWRAA